MTGRPRPSHSRSTDYTCRQCSIWCSTSATGRDRSSAVSTVLRRSPFMRRDAITMTVSTTQRASSATCNMRASRNALLPHENHCKRDSIHRSGTIAVMKPFHYDAALLVAECLRVFKTRGDKGMSLDRVLILLYVYREPGVDQGALADRIGLSPSVMSRAVGAMTGKWLDVEIPPTNRTQRRLYLSADGATFVERMFQECGCNKQRT